MKFFSDGLFTDLCHSSSEEGIFCERCKCMFSKEYIEEHLAEFTSEEKRDELNAYRRARFDKYQKLDAEQEKLIFEAEQTRIARQAKAIEKAKHEAEQKSLWKTVQ
jgi:hypothetical protein